MTVQCRTTSTETAWWLPLTPHQSHQRLPQSDSQRQPVIFSNECRFYLAGNDQQICMWRHRGQHQSEPFHYHESHAQKAWCHSTSTPTVKSAGTACREVWHVALANMVTWDHTEGHYVWMCSPINITHIGLNISSFFVPGKLFLPS